MPRRWKLCEWLMLLVKTPKLKLALKHATVARLLIYTVCKMSNAPLKSTQYLITVYLIESTSFVPLTVSPLNHFKRDHIQSLRRKNEWCILDSFSWALEFAPPHYKKSQTTEVGSSVRKHLKLHLSSIMWCQLVITRKTQVILYRIIVLREPP